MLQTEQFINKSVRVFPVNTSNIQSVPKY